MYECVSCYFCGCHDVRLCITLTFLIVYLQGTELFPTQLRSTGSGFAATVAAAVAIAGPSIVSLVKIKNSTNYVLRIYTLELNEVFDYEL